MQMNLNRQEDEGMTIEEQIIANDILREVSHLLKTPYQKEMLSTQTAKGIAKYPNTVNVEDYSIVGWIDHNVQELIDSTVYYKALYKKVKMTSSHPEENYFLWFIEKDIARNIAKLNNLEYIRERYLEGAE